MIPIPKEISSILSRLNSHGFEAFVVGGCIRDSLLGKTPTDWDICTAATPDKVQEIFADTPVLLTGLKHGTVTVLWNHQPIEITTFRKDGDYTDHRRPDSVTYTDDFKEDLKRRDFTINAMAYSPKTGIIDFFDGQEHLKKNLLCCVGDPKTRLSEDALRILRGLRFAAVYGFTIQEETARAIHLLKNTLTDISAERIYAELQKIIVAPHLGGILSGFSDVFTVIFPGVPEIFADANALSQKISALPEDFALRIAGIFSHGKDMATCQRSLRRLKADRKTTGQVLSLLGCLACPIPETLPEMRRRIRDYGLETVAGFLLLNPDDKATGYYKEIQEKHLCCTLADLAIDGDDLQETGGIVGAEVGKALNRSLDAVIAGSVPNEKTALLNFLFS